ncbi:MAG: crossover junction endodeoxyribonuclease RuvC [Nitrospinota bacterium]
MTRKPRSIGSLILGIDPGLSATGYGLIRPAAPRTGRLPQAKYVEAGVIRTSDATSLEERLVEIQRGIEEVLADFSPDVLAVEALYSHYAHPRTAILMGHARGVICCAAASRGLPVLNYAVTEIKKALTGNGRARKDQVQRAVAHVLGFPSLPEPPDAADALAVAICHLEARSQEAALSSPEPVRP